jgi:GNAT superfamily N-acetyltransferase
MWRAPEIATLFAALDATWAAAERAAIGEWVARRGAGGGSRVSSVWPKGDPGLPPEAAIDAACAVARGWGQTPLFQVDPADADLDDRLAARGFIPYDASLFLAAPARVVAAHGEGRGMVLRVRAPLAALDELWAQGGVGPARRAVMARTPPPSEALALRADDRVAAAAFVAAAGDVAMAHAIEVAPRFRRQGLGAAITAAAASWALENGAGTLALAVTERNAGARALYARLGFVDCGGYHYRRAPEGEPR